MPAFLPFAIVGSAAAAGINTIRKHLAESQPTRAEDVEDVDPTAQSSWKRPLDKIFDDLGTVGAELSALSTAAYQRGQKKVTDQRRRQNRLANTLCADHHCMWVKSAKQPQAPLPIVRELQEISHPLVKRLAQRGAIMNERFQPLVVKYMDPLFGSERNEQLQSLNADEKGTEISAYEQELNRDIGWSVITVGAALLGHLVAPGFYLLAFGVAIYLTRVPALLAYADLRNERRITLPFLATLNALGMWLGGYYIIGALSFVIFFLGEKLVVITQDRSHKQLINVFGQQPRTVWILVDETEVEIPFESLQVGNRLLLHAGQTIPADGVIVEGMATIDQHALTGEAQPAEKGIGDHVLAATTLLGGKLVIEVERAGTASVAAQIGDILNTTTGYQMAIESKGLQLAHDLALPTLVLGLMAWPVASYQAMVAILGASIGLNIKITGPLAMLNFLNLASKQGILVKDGRSLELMSRIDTVVFDKTGTLTLEQPHVVAVHPCGSLDADTLLTYAAAAEQRQPHPIAHAIVEAAAERKLTLPMIDEARYEIGYGIRVEIEGHVVSVGSDRYIALEGYQVPPAIQAIKATCHNLGHSLVLVAVDGQLAGAIELQPTLRPEAHAVIANLRKRGLDLVIISGDQEQPTRNLAQALGIKRYFADTLPEHKANHVKALQQEGRTVCFIGDGINDAIALKTANGSLSLRGATTAATDTAQIGLMAESLAQLPYLFDLGDEFAANMRQGFNAAVVPGIATIAGAYLGLVGITGSMVIWIGSLAYGLQIATQPWLGKRDGTPPVRKGPTT